ncbi:hypothetical protein E2C01_043439 [Portunus trituberculatus]|uniref:Uncharacterized protein n=1 Tax=Portunus trituberculatus TaxID=210409 RepID=A0A5B7FQB5_PORTR|nr:hypothetical protein [Portunus trituberculatus]
MSPSVPFTEMVHASYIGPTLEDNMSFFGPMDLTTPGVIEILGNASQPTLERNMSAVDRNSGWMALTRVAEELNCKDYLDNNTTFERNCMPLDDPMEMRKPHKANPSFMPIVVTHALTFLLGVSGNSVIVFSMAKDKGTRNVTRLCFYNLQTIYIPQNSEKHENFITRSTQESACQFIQYS